MDPKIGLYFLIIIIGCAVHILFGYSLFDIFCKFPLNYGMSPQSSNLSDEEIPSNRIVLFVLDGTRADSFFEAISNGKSPFLRDIIENRGVYGISHTKVPTETEPGLTAFCSGHFEDASLALQDLSSHTILTDSIFNQSDFSIGIGLDACMFSDVAESMYCVPSNTQQDYGDFKVEKNNYELIDTIIDLLAQSKKDKNGELYKNLNKKRVSFIHHLVQTDTIGHAFGPKSEKLINHLNGLDSYFEKMEKAFNDFYQDSKTTFIVTADRSWDGFKACTWRWKTRMYNNTICNMGLRD